MPVRIAALAAATALALSTCAALADDCAAPLAAMRAVPGRDYSATSVTTTQGKTQTAQLVMAGGKMYIQVGGAWHVSRMGAKEMLDAINDGLKTSKMICRRLGPETIGGQAATLYAVHNDNQGSVSEDRLWISSAGLPLKTENRLEGGSVVIVSTYDYAHAQVPPGVK